MRSSLWEEITSARQFQTYNDGIMLIVFSAIYVYLPIIPVVKFALAEIDVSVFPSEMKITEKSNVMQNGWHFHSTERLT